MFAVVKTGGKQYRVKSGDVIAVEKLAGEVGSVIVLSDVLAAGDGASVTLEKPALAKAQVSAEILAHEKGDKVIIFKKKRRHNYRRKNGHRQWHTTLKIGEIALNGGISAKAASAPEKSTSGGAAKAAAGKKAPAASRKKNVE